MSFASHVVNSLSVAVHVPVRWITGWPRWRTTKWRARGFAFYMRVYMRGKMLSISVLPAGACERKPRRGSRQHPATWFQKLQLLVEAATTSRASECSEQADLWRIKALARLRCLLLLVPRRHTGPLSQSQSSFCRAIGRDSWFDGRKHIHDEIVGPRPMTMSRGGQGSSHGCSS